MALSPWQRRMRDHAAVLHRAQGAQTLSISSVDFGHGEAAEVALVEKQVFPPQGCAVWMNEHLRRES